MSEYLSSVLEELVPRLDDERCDWGQVVADADAETSTSTGDPSSPDATRTSIARHAPPSRWRERWLTRRRLVALVAAVVVAAAVASASAIPLLLGQSVLPPQPRPGARFALTEQGIRFSFMVPPNANGWGLYPSISTGTSPTGRPISLNRSIVPPQDAEAIIYWTSFPHGDYADPCARVLGTSVGQSAADLAVAVSNAPGTKLVSGPADVTLGGRPAKHVVLTVRKNVGCDPGFFYKWTEHRGGALWETTEAGNTMRVWIVPVGGKRLFIAAATTREASSGLKREIQRIVASLRFGS